MTENPKESLYTTIAQQRDMLTKLFYAPLRTLGDECVKIWGNRSSLENALERTFSSVPYCKFLYALDANGRQITASMSREGLIQEHYDRDRSDRPYMREALLEKDISTSSRVQHYQQWPNIEGGAQTTDFILCAAYISLRALRPSLTAIQFVRGPHGAVLGFLGADFALRDLPETQHLYEEPRSQRRFKADFLVNDSPSTQTRLESKMDGHLDTVMSIMEELILVHGGYHIMLHFSSSQAIIWVMDDPYRYRLLTMNELTDPSSCLAYPKRPYPNDALVPFEKVREIFHNMKTLRCTEGSFYLRSGAVNIFNGMVTLNFSSDGSHYIPYEDFLHMDYSFWVGK